MTISNSYRLKIDEALKKYFPPAESPTKKIYDAIGYSLFSGGKRFRPVLVLLTAEALEGDIDTVLPTACAIEFLHTYSLIHDDLPSMDDDDLRRGQPTCHIKFGESTAILAGDGLIAEAFFLIADQTAIDPELIKRVIREIADAVSVRGMVGGQLIDIEVSGGSADLDTVKLIHRMKTGRLITASARCGAILSKADESQMSAVTEYAGFLGLAFQIADDILDIESSTAELGKSIGSDERKNKLTFPSVIGLEKSRAYVRELIEQAKKSVRNRVKREEGLCLLADFVHERKS